LKRVAAVEARGSGAVLKRATVGAGFQQAVTEMGSVLTFWSILFDQFGILGSGSALQKLYKGRNVQS
jgi:hypothetical protein